MAEQVVRTSVNCDRILDIVRRYYDTRRHSDSPPAADKFGFLLDEATLKRQQDDHEFCLRNILSDLLNTRATKFWCNLEGNENLKHLVREYGVPDEMRPQLWLSVMKAKIGDHFDVSS